MRILTVLAALLCFAGVSRAAFLLDPPQTVLKANLGEKMAWIDVVHTGGGPMAVELTVYDRELDEDGESVITGLKVNTDFTVYPAQIILQPGRKARVQVVYNGRGRITADKAFLLFAREVPLPVSDEENEEVRVGVNTLMQYYSVIAFDTGKPGRLTFVSSRMLSDGMVELVVENRSNGRVRADNLVITVSGRDKIRGFSGRKNSIMPGQRRRFTFPYSKALTAREVSFGVN